MNRLIPATVARTDKIAGCMDRISRIAHDVSHLSPDAAEQMYIAVETIHKCVVDILAMWNTSLAESKDANPYKMDDFTKALSATVVAVRNDPPKT